MGWTQSDMPDQAGRTVVVTGANSGLGLQATADLASKGAHVVMACRSMERGQAALDGILGKHPQARLELWQLDLADLASVRTFAERACAELSRLDVLVNNAGVMAIPYKKTADGFEMQIGTTHFGHFALTGLLLEPLLSTTGSRVVTVSSGMHHVGRMRFDDIDWNRSYSKWPAYGQAKLANLLFTFELNRRAQQADVDLRSVACHPGYTATQLQEVAAENHNPLLGGILGLGTKLVAMDPVQGVLPCLYAATAQDVRGGDFFGPDGVGEIRGYPSRVKASRRARDEDDAGRLWEISAQRTGVDYGALESPARVSPGS